MSLYDKVNKLQNKLCVESLAIYDRADDLRNGVRFKWSLAQLQEKLDSVHIAVGAFNRTLQELEQLNAGGEHEQDTTRKAGEDTEEARS